MNRVFQNSEVEVRWCAGGLFVRGGESGLLLDCPVGVEHYLGDRAAELDAVLLTSGRIQAVGGIIGLLEAVNRYKRKDRPLTIYSCVGEERGPALVACWVRDWPSDVEIRLDTSVPGRDIHLGEFEIHTESVPHGEPAWAHERVNSRVGVAVRLEVGATAIAWVPGAAPHPIVGRLCRGASLAVVEVAGLSWPRADKVWRLSEEKGREAGGGAQELWLVNDAGERVGSAQA